MSNTTEMVKGQLCWNRPDDQFVGVAMCSSGYCDMGSRVELSISVPIKRGSPEPTPARHVFINLGPESLDYARIEEHRQNLLSLSCSGACKASPLPYSIMPENYL